MKKTEMHVRYFVLFLVSLICILLELFLTRVLNLKAWNHVVYTVIPFAMLGFGIGANIVLIFNDFFKRFKTIHILAVLLLLIAITTLTTVVLLKNLPVKVEYIVYVFTNVTSILKLLLAYTIFMVPFILIGFCVVYLFRRVSSPSRYNLRAIGFKPLLGYFDGNILLVSGKYTTCYCTSSTNPGKRPKLALSELPLVLSIGLKSLIKAWLGSILISAHRIAYFLIESILAGSRPKSVAYTLLNIPYKND